MTNHIAYIGLGSNLNNPQYNIHSALKHLRQNIDIDLLCCSKLYANPAVAPTPQPPYLNAVASINTKLSPLTLLHALHTIEKRQGRIRDSKQRYAARTLDLDLLIYDAIKITTDELILPHPRMMYRSFVLIPLMEIAPQLKLDNGKTVTQCLAMLNITTVARPSDNQSTIPAQQNHA